MKHLKLYEQFSNSNQLELKLNEVLSNKELLQKLYKIYNSFPSVVKEFFKKDRINIAPLIKIEKKYKIFERIKKLWDGGVRSYNDIINRILPKNESIVGLYMAISAIAGIGLIVFFIWLFLKAMEFDNDIWSLVVGLFSFFATIGSLCATVAFPMAIQDYYAKKAQKIEIPREERIEKMKEKIKEVVIDSGVKTDTVMLYIDENGDYKVKVVTDETKW